MIIHIQDTKAEVLYFGYIHDIINYFLVCPISSKFSYILTNEYLREHLTLNIPFSVYDRNNEISKLCCTFSRRNLCISRLRKLI